MTDKAHVLVQKKDLLRQLLDKRKSPANSTGMPLQAMERDGIAPLSYSQRRLWLYEQKSENGTTTYNMPIALLLEGELCVASLEAAFVYILSRHEVLRTYFPTDTENLYATQKVVSKPNQFDLGLQAITAEEVSAAVQAHAQAPFDLTKGPLLKAKLLQLDEQQHVLLFNQHHIITDGWSFGILLRELMHVYTAVKAGRKPSLPELPIQYIDYAYWQQQQDCQQEQSYWRQQLVDYEPNFSLPYDRPGDPTRSTAKSLKRAYPSNLCNAITEFSRAHNVSLFMSLLASMAIVFSRYTQSHDFCIGTTTAGRNHPYLEGLIGYFINILALRIRPDEEIDGLSFLNQIKNITLQAYEHSLLPFEDVISELGSQGDNLIPVIIRHQNFPEVPLDGLSTELRIEQIKQATNFRAKCALDIGFFGEGDNIDIVVEYASDIFDESTILRLIDHHQNILRELINKPKQMIKHYQLLTLAEQAKLLPAGNTIYKDLAEVADVVTQFTAQVAKQPYAIACYEDGLVDNIAIAKTINYKDLNGKANQFAYYLLKQGIAKGDRVAICLPRSIDYLACLLAIWKVGAVYIPLDPDYPNHYIEQILTDAAPHLVLTDIARQGISSLAHCIDSLDCATLDDSDLNTLINLEDIAYIMYTSGSTGRPKGVMVPHRQIINWQQSLQSHLPFMENEVVAQKTTNAFAVSMKEFLSGLLAGCAQVILRNEIVKDSHALLDALARHKISRLNLVPSHLQTLLWELKNDVASQQSLRSLRYCITAGEPLTTALLADVKALLPWVQVINNYGCTEINDISYFTNDNIDPQSVFAPIGEPIDNSRVYLLDQQLRVVPVGVVGQLYVDSASVSHGYWQQASLTAESYIPHPFSEVAGARLYCTGDMARYLPNGSLEYMSRKDFQIKIRGNRIDVRQVEKVLSDMPGVKQGLVATWSATNEPLQLVAYYMPSAEIEQAQIRQYLSELLPAYMVPAYYVALEAFPKLPNGKLNRRALPEINPQELPSRQYIAPSNKTEEILCTIIQDLLGLKKISIEASFFDIGGDSLSAMKVVSIAKNHNIFLKVDQVFEYQTVKKLAEICVSSDSNKSQSLLLGEWPLTAGQHWFLSLDMTDPHWGHTFNFNEFGYPYNKALMEEAFHQVLCYHDNLRAKFLQTENGWQQIIVSPEALAPGIAELDYSHLAEEEQWPVIEQDIISLQNKVDFAKPPLIKLWVLKRGDDKSCLIFMLVHHLLTDAFSSGLIINDLNRCYAALLKGEQANLGEKLVSTKDWTEATIALCNSPEKADTADYWMNLPWDQALTIPVDHPENIKQDIFKHQAQDHNFFYVPRVAALAKRVLPKTGISFIEVLVMATLKTFDDIPKDYLFMHVLDSGRSVLGKNNNMDPSQTVGWLSLPKVHLMRKPSASTGSIDALHDVHNQLEDAAETSLLYQPLCYLHKDETVREKMLALPSPEIWLNYIGIFNTDDNEKPNSTALESKLADIRSKLLWVHPDNKSHVKFMLVVAVINDYLMAQWFYCGQLFESKTVSGFGQKFITDLNAFTEDFDKEYPDE